MKDRLMQFLVAHAIGIWLPMILIAIVYTLLFCKLKDQAEIRERTSSQDAEAQLNCISRRFKKVLIAFYVCYLPFTIQYTIMHCFYYLGININSYASNIALTITNNLWVINCCVNPIIYSKIHTRIYERIRSLLITVRPSRVIHKVHKRPNQQQQHQAGTGL